MFNLKKDIITTQFKKELGYNLNLDNPTTFNEKLQWLKFYYYDELITKCSDKYLVREYIRETIGEEYLIPLIGVWDRVEDIDFDKLPNQFVLKVNWGSGQNIIVKDKNKLDIEEAKNKLRCWMLPTSNHYYYSYELGYKYIKPKVICEQYIEQMDGNLIDYKMFCFSGKTKYIGVYFNRGTDNFSKLYYDYNWNKQNMCVGNMLYEGDIKKPKVLNKLIELSNLLSLPFVHVRVDSYIINDNIYFGELTFYNAGGYTKFIPSNWDYKFGELLELPKKKKMEYDFVDRDTLVNQVSNLEIIVKEYRDLEHNLNYANYTINTLNSDINIKNNTIDYLSNEIEDLKLNVNWFSLLSIFGIQLFSISNNANYLRLTILGIKLTFKVNEKSINKIAWWIPIKSLRNNFRTKFKYNKN